MLRFARHVVSAHRKDKVHKFTCLHCQITQVSFWLCVFVCRLQENLFSSQDNAQEGQEGLNKRVYDLVGPRVNSACNRLVTGASAIEFWECRLINFWHSFKMWMKIEKSKKFDSGPKHYLAEHSIFANWKIVNKKNFFKKKDHSKSVTTELAIFHDPHGSDADLSRIGSPLKALILAWLR